MQPSPEDASDPAGQELCVQRRPLPTSNTNPSLGCHCASHLPATTQRPPLGFSTAQRNISLCLPLYYKECYKRYRARVQGRGVKGGPALSKPVPLLAPPRLH